MTHIHVLLAAPLLAFALSGVSPNAALAQNAATAATAANTQALPQVDAEIRKIDTTSGKVTLKHGDIPNLDMPGMTMVFQLRDPAQLTGLKVGDKVRFRADQFRGTYTVVDIVPAP